ncbi:hypothetical protein Vi05172_g9871 [Venturia inaequalis]|uniref:Uncharacterized protein n=1 Tax=Venturia inaequalis TaxID=5025 RepID=A0A8H3Z743_VENIN|nr:hypothetical protein EG327_003336 [Venturia inaequalis]RDI80111.1 hypothetical protein Vi05172_g9871 [Venturia inaequalis]
MTGFTNVGRRPGPTALQSAMTQYDTDVTNHIERGGDMPAYESILQTLPVEHRPEHGSTFSDAARTWAEDERVRALGEEKKKKKKKMNLPKKIFDTIFRKKDHDRGGGGGGGIPVPAR